MLPCGCSNQTTGALPFSRLFCKGSYGICQAPLSHCNTPSVSTHAHWERRKNTGTGVSISILQKTISGRLSYHWLRLVRLLHCMDMHRCSLMKARLKHAGLLIYKSRHVETFENKKPTLISLFNRSFLFSTYCILWNILGKLCKSLESGFFLLFREIYKQATPDIVLHLAKNVSQSSSQKPFCGTHCLKIRTKWAYIQLSACLIV